MCGGETRCLGGDILLTMTGLVYVFAAMMFTVNLDFFIVLPLGPQLMKNVGLSAQQFGTLVSIYYIGAAVFGFMAALFADRFNKKDFLLFSYLGFVIGVAITCLSLSYDQLLIGRGLAGACGGVVTAQILALVADLVSQERRGWAVGVVRSSYAAAMIVGVPVGLFLSKVYRWQKPFVFLVYCSVFLFFIAMAKVPLVQGSGLPKKTNPFLPFVQLFSQPSQLWAVLLGGVAFLAQYCILPFISPSFLANVGVSEGELAFMIATSGFFSFIASPHIGKLSDRLGHFKVFATLSILAIFPILAISHIPSSMAFALIAAILYNVFGFGRLIPMTTMLTLSSPSEARGSFMIVNTSMGNLNAGIAAFVAGIIVTRDASGRLEHYDQVGYIATVATIISLWIAYKLNLKQKALQ